MILQALCFYLFAAVTVGSAFFVIAARNPVHSVLFLILAFFSSAGLFVLIGAEFIAMILVIVYVGAVAVLFLFVVMMLDINFVQLRQGFLQYAPIGAIVGVIVFAELYFIGRSWVSEPILAKSLAAPTPDASVTTNTDALGQLFYTHYVYLFQGAGMIRDDEYRRARSAVLHTLCLPVSGCRHDPSGRDDRSDRADSPHARGRPEAEHCGSGPSRPPRIHRDKVCRAGSGHLSRTGQTGYQGKRRIWKSDLAIT
jgi:NADH-quinone oxidoreductase subunit J